MSKDSDNRSGRTVKLTAKPGSSLEKIFKYLEEDGLDIHGQILETILTCYLPICISIEDPRSRDKAIVSANKLRAIENMIRERYGLIRSAEAIPGLSGIVEPQRQLTNSLLIPESVKESSQENRLDLLQQPEIEEEEASEDIDIDPETEDLRAKFTDMGVLYG